MNQKSNPIQEIALELVNKIDWDRQFDNLRTWIKENAGTISDKLNIAKEWILENADEIQDECIKQYNQLLIEFKEGIEDLKIALKEAINDINSPLEKARNLKKFEYEVLNKTIINDIIRANIVPGSNQVAVYRRLSNNKIIFYICYLKNNKIIENEDNIHIIIKTDQTTHDLEKIFNDNKLIILK